MRKCLLRVHDNLAPFSNASLAKSFPLKDGPFKAKYIELFLIVLVSVLIPEESLNIEYISLMWLVIIVILLYNLHHIYLSISQIIYFLLIFFLWEKNNLQIAYHQYDHIHVE